MPSFEPTYLGIANLGCFTLVKLTSLRTFYTITSRDWYGSDSVNNKLYRSKRFHPRLWRERNLNWSNYDNSFQVETVNSLQLKLRHLSFSYNFLFEINKSFVFCSDDEWRLTIKRSGVQILVPDTILIIFHKFWVIVKRPKVNLALCTR